MGRIRHPPDADETDRGIAIILGLGGMVVVALLGGIALLKGA